MADSEQNPGGGAFLPAVAIVIGFILLGALVYLLYWNRSPDAVAYGGNTPEERAETLREVRERESELLESYGWVDEDEGIVRLPIDRAMELTLEELNQEGEEQ